MKLDEAYAAGLLDGEGTVTFMHHNSKASFRTPTVSLTSTTEALVDFMVKVFGGNKRVHKTYKAHHRKAWVWSVHYNAALKCLRRTLPYLREPEKRRRAELLLAIYPALTRRNGRYKPEEIRAKLKFEEEFFDPTIASSVEGLRSCSIDNSIRG